MSDREEPGNRDPELDWRISRERSRWPEHRAIVLEVRLLPGERFAGWIGPAGSPVRRDFSGWLDFMVAVTSLRTSPPAAEP